MTSIDFFYQGEGLQELGHIEVSPDHTFGVVKTLVVERHGLEADVLIFLDDADEPLDELIIVREHIEVTGIKAHLHRCRHVAVAVTFNGETVHHEFAPGSTVARVKRWAAEHEFGMSEEDASEHVLQIAGTLDRPSPATHLGALTKCPDCQIAFDLVLDQRINGCV